jgi:hypothetical protein
MQLHTAEFTFTLLTPCFSGTALGKQDDHAEMRVPPIRGHIRFWHRELFGADDCNRVWGSTEGGACRSSRIGVRFVGGVSNVQADPKSEVLPHKPPGKRGPRPALAERERFTFELQQLVGCTTDDWNRAQRAAKLWLLVGCLGLRANRAAGSLWPDGDWVPHDRTGLTRTLQDLGFGSCSVALIGENEGKTAERLRETASDTIQGNPYRQVFGGINDRLPSATKFKVIKLVPGLCLLALAPRQDILCEDKQRRPILREAERLLLRVKHEKSRWPELGTWNHILP